MWMKAVIAVLIVLTGVVFAIGGFLKEDGRHIIAEEYFLAGYTLSTLTILLILTHAILVWRRPPTRRALANRQRFKRAFGVYWDSDLHPLCPVCKSPLTLSRAGLLYRIDGGVPLPDPVPHCMKCNKAFPLYDDDANHLTLAEAKKRLSQKEPEARTLKAQEPEPAQQVTTQNTEQPKKRELKSRYNVLWDDNRDPFCPLCEKRIIETQVRRIGSRLMGDLKCMYCQVAYVLKDDDGQHITFDQAKALLSLELSGINAAQADTSEPFKPDEKDKKIIAYLYAGVDCLDGYIARAVGIDTQEAQLRLNRFIEHKYVHPPRAKPTRPFAGYRLTDKGIQFAIDNGLRGESAMQPSKLQTANDYRPDETAIKILSKIEKDIVWESELARELKLEPAQVSSSLRLLEKYGFIRLHPPGERGPYYQLTPKGRGFLNKPVRNIPFPTREAPRVLRYFNAYHPDDLENAILLYMYEEDTPRLLEQIADKYGLNIHEARLRMNRLKDGGYVYQSLDHSQRRQQYGLRAEGVEYALWLKPLAE